MKKHKDGMIKIRVGVPDGEVLDDFIMSTVRLHMMFDPSTYCVFKALEQSDQDDPEVIGFGQKMGELYELCRFTHQFSKAMFSSIEVLNPPDFEIEDEDEESFPTYTIPPDATAAQIERHNLYRQYQNVSRDLFDEATKLWRDYRTAVEAWFERTQDEETRQDNAKELRVQHGTSVLYQVADKWEEATRESNRNIALSPLSNGYFRSLPVSVANIAYWEDLQEALEEIEVHGIRELELDFPSQELEKYTMIVPPSNFESTGSYNEVIEASESKFWAAVDSDDPTTLTAEKTFSLFVDVMDKAVALYQQRCKALQLQGVSEREAEMQAAQDGAVSEWLIAGLKLRTCFFLEVREWHERQGQKLAKPRPRLKTGKRLQAKFPPSVRYPTAQPAHNALMLIGAGRFASVAGDNASLG